MTDDMMNLRTLLEKTPDADLLREMIGLPPSGWMELEVGAAAGAGYGARRARCGWPSATAFAQESRVATATEGRPSS